MTLQSISTDHSGYRSVSLLEGEGFFLPMQVWFWEKYYTRDEVYVTVNFRHVGIKEDSFCKLDCFSLSFPHPSADSLRCSALIFAPRRQ